MKVKLTTFAVLLLITLASCNNNEQSAKNKAQAADSTAFTTVKWIDSIVQFGTINMGETITVRFKCKNTGNKPLIIANARPGCGCTIADFTKEPIAPNEEGVVTAAFDSKKTHGGQVKKTIIVTTNTSNGKEHYLMFEGEIKGENVGNDKVAIPHKN